MGEMLKSVVIPGIFKMFVSRILLTIFCITCVPISWRIQKIVSMLCKPRNDLCIWFR